MIEVFVGFIWGCVLVLEDVFFFITGFISGKFLMKDFVYFLR